ncbi:hypothetical protein AVDCRST_MAG94-2956 [uncultured Leptolyngbya sp.]|uniref:Uncharacterized protein n=1 Tax=uncultured Leptolyngbya sp. TaxID=332963 RepID=A0A6J4M9L6_9CYAN|nr:hypothetical protein AVDCRST_MAG94-2956 [uncultured Leptolyngbya sp.]
MDVCPILTHLRPYVSQWGYILENVPRRRRLVGKLPLDEPEQIRKNP